MSARGWVVAALIAVSVPAHAEPVEPAAAPEAAAASAVEEALLRVIKRAERESFEQHETGRYLEGFAPDAVWIEGRREVADAHDVEVGRAAMAQMLARRHRAPLSGKEQLFLRDVEVEVAGDRAVVLATARRVFFGGQDAIRRRYVMRRAGEGWQIAEVRSWPVQEMMQGLMRIYDDAYWLDLDEQADKAVASQDPLLGRIGSLVKARRIAEAYALAKTATEETPADPVAWRARADLAFELGRVDEALAAAKQTAKLRPAEPLPPHLQ